MPETSLGAILRLLHRTLPVLIWRASIAIGLAVAGVMLVAFGVWGSPALGLRPWMGGALACLLGLALGWALWPVWSVRVVAVHALALVLAAQGSGALPEGRAQIIWLRVRVSGLGGLRLSRLVAAMRAAHRDVMILAQGLPALLPVPALRAAPFGRTWLKLLAHPLADLSLGEALARSEAPEALSDAAAAQVALSAVQVQDLVRGLAGVTLAAVIGFAAILLAVALICGLSGLGGPWPLTVTIVVMTGGALWMALGAPLVLALVMVRRSSILSGGTAPEPWLARLDASSKAYRAVAAWPGAAPARPRGQKV